MSARERTREDADELAKDAKIAALTAEVAQWKRFSEAEFDRRKAGVAEVARLTAELTEWRGYASVLAVHGMTPPKEEQMATRQEVYTAIDGERAYQAERWNETTTDTKGLHSLTEFLVYIQDYTNEALHYTSRNADPAAADFVRHSMRKIAALAVAAMEQQGVLLR